jgi:hypothetical protein
MQVKNAYRESAEMTRAVGTWRPSLAPGSSTRRQSADYVSYFAIRGDPLIAERCRLGLQDDLDLAHARSRNSVDAYWQTQWHSLKADLEMVAQCRRDYRPE